MIPPRALLRFHVDSTKRLGDSLCKRGQLSKGFDITVSELLQGLEDRTHAISKPARAKESSR
jgi:hypothetical protein